MKGMPTGSGIASWEQERLLRPWQAGREASAFREDPAGGDTAQDATAAAVRDQ